MFKYVLRGVLRQKAPLSIINSVGSNDLREEIFHLRVKFPVVWIPIEMTGIAYEN